MEFFKQPLLRQAQLAYGMTWRTDQPEPTEPELVPWEPIVVLAAEPDDLHARRGIAFQETEDQLDDLKLAVLDLASGRLTVTGAGYTDDAIAAAVAEAGYEVAR